MERVIALVNKLQEQIANNSPLVYLTATAEMLVTELRQQNTATHLGKVSIFHPTILSPIINRVTIGNQSASADTLVSTDSIPVIEPSFIPEPVVEVSQSAVSNTVPAEEVAATDNFSPVEAVVIVNQEPEKIIYTLDIPEEALLEELPIQETLTIAPEETTPTLQEPTIPEASHAATMELLSDIPQESQPFTPTTVSETETIAPTVSTTPESEHPISEKTATTLPSDKKTNNFLQSAFFMDEQFAQIPTLPIQEPKKEYFELAGNFDNEPSINDSLKQYHQQQEVGSTLQETPIKDLRKGIGINDRFIFINELFRGDEAMYERSLKTINNFSIFPEAEFWIKRELKVKLGWDNSADSVKLFDQLVRRRFS